MRIKGPGAASRWATLAAVVALLQGCGGGGGGGDGAGSAVGTPLETRTIGCADFLSVDTPIGRLLNNVWNKQAAGSFAARQCLEQRVVANALQYGWSWTWPTVGAAVYAYPEVIVGAKPWDPGPGNDARFPRRIADLRRLEIAYDVDIQATGQHNLAASVWVIRTPTVANPPVVTDISAEIMFWSWSTLGEGSQAGATLVGEVTVDGRTWLVWAARDWGDSSGTFSNRWTYVAYQMKSPSLAVRFDARPLIADAVARGLVDPQHHLANVELGTEVVSGSGSAFVRSFGVTVE